MTDTDFDPTPYFRPPVLDAASGISLGIALLHALPKGAPAPVKAALKRLRARTAALQEAWRAGDAIERSPDPRPADRRLDVAWGALFARLDAYANLPENYPRARRAAELEQVVFPAGLSFLKLAYNAEWAESEKRLARIDEGLAADLVALAGDDFLAEVRAAHAAYGEALGITRAKGAPRASVSMVEPLRAFARALRDYTVKIVGQIELDDPASVAFARAALRPLDDLRALGAARRARGGPAEPSPPPPPDSPVPDPEL